MKIKFYLVADKDGNPDVLFIDEMRIGNRLRARAVFTAARQEYERLAASPNSGVIKQGEGRFLIEGQMP